MALQYQDLSKCKIEQVDALN